MNYRDKQTHKTVMDLAYFLLKNDMVLNTAKIDNQNTLQTALEGLKTLNVEDLKEVHEWGIKYGFSGILNLHAFDDVLKVERVMIEYFLEQNPSVTVGGVNYPIDLQLLLNTLTTEREGGLDPATIQELVDEYFLLQSWNGQQLITPTFDSQDNLVKGVNWLREGGRSFKYEKSVLRRTERGPSCAIVDDQTFVCGKRAIKYPLPQLLDGFTKKLADLGYLIIEGRVGSRAQLFHLNKVLSKGCGQDVLTSIVASLGKVVELDGVCDDCIAELRKSGGKLNIDDMSYTIDYSELMPTKEEGTETLIKHLDDVANTLLNVLAPKVELDIDQLPKDFDSDHTSHEVPHRISNRLQLPAPCISTVQNYLEITADEAVLEEIAKLSDLLENLEMDSKVMSHAIDDLQGRLKDLTFILDNGQRGWFRTKS